MCAAITRWVQYDPTSQGTYGEGRNAGCVGARGYSIGTASIGDTFNIGPTTNKLYISIDGDTGPYLTLYSGTNLDPRFVARDITEKMRSLGKTDARWDDAICKWENTPADGNKFKIYSGSLGVASSVVVSTVGAESAHSVLGFTTRTEAGGTVTTNNFAGTMSVSGVYKGMMPEMYKVVITSDNDAARGIGASTKSISYDGTFSTGGVYNYSSDTSYTITIDVTNGTTMGGGTGNVPIMTWTASPSADDSSVNTELLYPDHWYNIGTRGLMVKFSDAVFANGYWTVPCYEPDYSSGSNTTDIPGAAYFAYSSDRGDMGAAALTPVSGTTTALGSRGLQIQFNPVGGTDYLGIRDEFLVVCNSPKPTNYNIGSVNFGNVTVSTESDTRSVIFEVESGAYQLSSVKFGLQSHGSFAHHYAGNNDTMFRYGTVGPGNPSGLAPEDGIEWYPTVVAADIDSDISPTYLYSTKANLEVVATADDSQLVGNKGLVADPVWFNIKLGSSETGASTCNYRLFFDYS
jgi:hypothetical protein